MEEDDAVEAFREVNLSDGKCNVSLYVCAEEEKKIDEDPDYASELFKAALEGRLPAACDDSETGGGSDNAVEDTGRKEKKKKSVDIEWDSEATWVFLRVIKKNTDLLPLIMGNRKALFKKVKEDLKEIGCEIPFESIRQKFNSLITTYKRIQFKAKRVGKVETRWEFYKVFDEIMKVAEAESITAKKQNGIIDPVKSFEFVDIKPEPEFIDVDALLDDDAPDESSPTPFLTHENSNDMSRETSPGHSRGQKLNKKSESTGKSVSKTPVSRAHPGPASKKRKRAATKDVAPTKDPPEISLQDSPIKVKASRGQKVEDSCPALADVASSSGTNGLMKGAEHVIVSGEGFNHAATLLFIDCVKKHKAMLKLKQSAEMFTQIRKEMANEGFSFPEAKLRKKWYNLLISYRRILERANETGDLVSSWPYYLAIDSIIVDTKVLAQNRENNINGYMSSHEASGSKEPKGHRLSDNTRVGGFEEEDDTTTPKVRGSKAGSVIDLLRRSDDWSNNSNNEEDGEFQRNLLEEWEQRELRREERDIVKLEVLKKIAKSMTAMNRKQDVLIDLLKNLK